jgi:hypothetical protein
MHGRERDNLDAEESFKHRASCGYDQGVRTSDMTGACEPRIECAEGESPWRTTQANAQNAHAGAC